MNPRFLLLICILFSPYLLQAQDTTKPLGESTNTVRKVDSLKTVRAVPRPVQTVIQDTAIRDSATAIVVAYVDTNLISRRLHGAGELFPVTGFYKTIYGSYVGGYMKGNEQFNVTAQVRRIPELVRNVENRDWVFYFYCGLLLCVAFINLAYHKYFVDVFRVFFNTSMRQKQLREQLSQSPQPSLLLNLVFCISGSVFLYFILKHYGIKTGFHPIIEILIGIGALAGIYIVKFIFVYGLGWMFDRRQAAESYMFTVMLVNKVAGLVLIPLGILLAYGEGGAREVVLTLTILLLIILGIMRLAKGYMSISGLRINLIQFLVFVGAFEIIPAMLIYKVLLRVFV